MTREYYLSLLEELLQGVENGAFDDLNSIPERYRQEHLQGLFLLRNEIENGEVLFQKLQLIVSSCEEKRIKDKIGYGETVKVVFLCDSASQWNYEYIYRRLEADTRFSVAVVVTPLADREEYAWRKRYEDTYRFFEAAGYKLLDGMRSCDDVSEYWQDCFSGYPDIIFHSTPYYNSLRAAHQYINMPLNILHIYVPYAVIITGDEKAEYNRDHVYNSHFVNAMYRVFCETEFSLNRYKEMELLKGRNVCCSGYPRMDYFYMSREYSDEQVKKLWKIPEGKAPDEIKKIIIAPHWSMGKTAGFSFSTFRDNAYFLLYLAEKHKSEISIILKPHPNMSAAAVSSGMFESIEEYRGFLNRWDSLPNAKVVEEGRYLDIFDTSDAMVLDSVSFVFEYGYTKKPIIFLKRKGQSFNDLGRLLLDSQYQCNGNDYIGIEELLHSVVMRGEDHIRERRERIVNERLNYFRENGMTASDYILKDLFSKWCN